MTFQRVLTLAPPLILLSYLASSIDGWFYQDFGILPLYGELVILGYLIAQIAVSATITGENRKEIAQPTIVIIGAIGLYALWTAASYIYSPQGEAVTDILVQRIKTALFLIVLIIFFADQRARASFTALTVAIVLASSAIVTYDFIEPTFSSVPGRGAGFFLNSNDAGAALVLLGLVATTRSPLPITYVIWSAVAIGVLATFSRSAWLLLVVAIFALSVTGKLGGGRGRFIFIGVVLLVFAVVFALYLSGDLYLFVANSPIAEFLDPNTLARLGARGVALDDYSSIEREDVLSLGFQYFFSSPFLGHGVGATHVWEESVSTHNMIALLGAELGILGIIAYLAIIGTLLARGSTEGRIIGTIFLIWGMTTHNQLDDPNTIIAIAFAIASIPLARPHVDHPALHDKRIAG